MSNNPYSSPVQAGKGVSAPASMHPMQPLHDVAGWLKFVGWVMIIIGVLYCITIVGLIFGWVPIWMGILAKGAAERLRAGFASGDNGQLHEASRQLSTYFTIMGVLMAIWVVLMAIYICVILFMIATVGFRGLM